MARKRPKAIKFETFKQQMLCTRCRDPKATLTVTFRQKTVAIEYECKKCWPDSLTHARERARLTDVIKLLIDLSHSRLMETLTTLGMDWQSTRAWANRLHAEATRQSPWDSFLMFDKLAKKKKAVTKWTRPAIRRKTAARAKSRPKR